MTKDYRSTLFLPKTDFPMRADLPHREPKIAAHWDRIDLYRRLRENAEGREKFILHDGPPYANGELHMGHALNKILKDVIVRSQQMTGKDAPYVPGWDCHGLPIEWKIEEKFRKAGKRKGEVEPGEFRKECRAFALRWVDIQKEQFKRLGITGDWENPYLTMNFDAEAQIVTELLKFVANGSLYQGSKPVMWSVVEQTALAEAEIEYHDHKSTMIDAAFPVINSGNEELVGAGVVIWTTTPWTIPGNRAIAFNQEFDYALIKVVDQSEDSLANVGQRLVVASSLLGSFCERVGISEYERIGIFSGADLQGTICAHPLRAHGYNHDVPLLSGDHVTLEQGTGFVHTAPGHGAEDFELGQQYGLEVPQTVGGDGLFYDHVPLFSGQHVFKVDPIVCDALREAGKLVAIGKIEHSYPHSWRSKAPLIFRNTPQWFISMTSDGLRQKALEATESVRWIPNQSLNRIQAMLEDRPDWLVSRQRAWGVPLTLFVHKDSRKVLCDEEVNRRIVAAVKAGGADAWFKTPAAEFLGSRFDPEAYEQVTDILDVWFDSGSTHSFVLEQRDALAWPASLYVEGTDQHRGWFQSSLLEACGTRGRAPYEAVLTHGFVQNEDGRKMAKSSGNATSPQTVIKQSGADILRLWTVSTNYFEDVRIGGEILKGPIDAYRKIRNTFRFLLGNLADFGEDEKCEIAEMPELERWVLHRLFTLNEDIRRNIDNFEFNPVYQALYQFCITDLSTFYFDIRKDSLYCDSRMNLRRRAVRTVLAILFRHLTAWFAPILVFTTEELWKSRFGQEADSIHLQQFPEIPATWEDQPLAERWARIRRIRRVITGALEQERQRKSIGSSLQAHPKVHLSDQDDMRILSGLDMAEISITSAITLSEKPALEECFALEDTPGVSVTPGLAEGEKCARCWRVLTEVDTRAESSEICNRCRDAIRAFEDSGSA